MSNHDEDLRGLLRQAAERAKPTAGAEARLLREARRRRRITAAAGALALIVLVGGLAGAATLVGDRGGIMPAPGPETLTESDLGSMTVNELAAALFKDGELTDAVPTEAGFSLSEIIRHGPERTNHDYATVGVQMDGPVNYSRVIFFVHPSEEAATAMGIRRSELLSRDWKMQRDEEEDVKAFAVSNAPPGTECGIVYGQLLSCHAVVGRVVVLTQSGDQGPSTPQVTDEELEAAKALMRAFGSYLERVYPEHQKALVARYFFEARSRDASASGVLEVNSQEGTLCYEATTENIQASHLLRNTGVVAGGRRFERNIVVTFFDPDDREHGAELPSGAPICFQEEQLSELEGGLQMLIDDPEDFRVDFHRGPKDEPGLVAELMTSDEAFAGTTYVDGRDDVAVHVPRGWHVAERSLTSGLVDPREILSLGTGPMPVGGERCEHQPENALESMGPADAFVSVQERVRGADNPARSESFKAAVEEGNYDFDTCVKLDGIRAYWVPFSDEGRNFYLLAAIGESAPRGGDELWEVVESLDFSPETGPSTRKVDGCPVTTPAETAFVPPGSYPPRPPDLYQKEWYGSARLWTWISSEGEVWRGLPDEDGDGSFTEKTFWWSEAMGNELAPITVRGRQLDGPESFKTRAPGGGGSREDIGSFMLVGIEIPAGCWKLTATYRGTELSYVVLVKDQP